MVNDYAKATKELSTGPLYPVYLVCGRESFLQESYLVALRNRVFPAGTEATFDLNYLEVDAEEEPVEKALESAQTFPFLAERRLVLVKRPREFSAGKGKRPGVEESGGEEDDSADAPGLAEGGSEGPLLRYLAEPPPTTVLVFLVRGAPDRRKKLFKALDKVGLVVDCGPPKESEMPSWIRQRASQLGAQIAAEAAEALAARTGPDLTLADGEIKKLLTYCGGRPVQASDVELLVAGVAETSIFKLLDAVGARRPQEAMARLSRILVQGEPPVRILFMVARQVRLVLACQVMIDKGYTQREIEASLGLSPYAARTYISQRHNFSREELVWALGRILEADVDLKTSHGDARTILELCLLDLCRKQPA